MTKHLHILDYFSYKFLFFLKKKTKKNIILEKLQNLDYIIIGIEWDLIYILKKIWKKKFCLCDHIGRHLGILSEPSVMPIYAGSFRPTNITEHFGR